VAVTHLLEPGLPPQPRPDRPPPTLDHRPEDATTQPRPALPPLPPTQDPRELGTRRRHRQTSLRPTHRPPTPPTQRTARTPSTTGRRLTATGRAAPRGRQRPHPLLEKRDTPAAPMAVTSPWAPVPAARFRRDRRRGPEPSGGPTPTWMPAEPAAMGPDVGPQRPSERWASVTLAAGGLAAGGQAAVVASASVLGRSMRPEAFRGSRSRRRSDIPRP
jgi:hypothetical protein